MRTKHTRLLLRTLQPFPYRFQRHRLKPSSLVAQRKATVQSHRAPQDFCGIKPNPRGRFHPSIPTRRQYTTHLEILEPALDEMGGDKEEPQTPSRASMKVETDTFHRGVVDAAQRSGEGGNDKLTLEANRSAARLAWRCVQAARAAARLVPSLSVQALLPAAALRLPHSCTPNVRVPAGDRRGYNANGGGAEAEKDDSVSGAAGWPLSVATVALRDVSAGSSLTCSWVDAEEDYTVRADLLGAYVFPSWDTRASVVTPMAGGGRGATGGGNSRRDGGQMPPEAPPLVKLEGETKRFPTVEERRIWEGRGGESGCGCWCLKCQIERQYQPGVQPLDPSEMDIFASLAVDGYR